MRLIVGGAPGASLAEMHSAMRDHPRLAAPCLPSEVHGFADLLAPMPPSKAHIKRLKRPRPEIGKVSQKPDPLPLTDPFVFVRQQLRQITGPCVHDASLEGSEYARNQWQAARDRRFFAGGGRKRDVE